MSQLEDRSVAIRPDTNWPRISDYAIIGDCRSAALVANTGSIEWLCWPRFDSPSIFAAILDRQRGGFWKICPSGAENAPYRRTYAPGTNVLCTTFESATGTAILTDLMPVESERAKRLVLTPYHELIRHLECTRGEINIELDFYPRADYGSRDVRLRQVKALGISLEVDDTVYWLRSSVPLTVEGGHATAQVTLRAGESASFSLTFSEESPAVLPPLGEWTTSRIKEPIGWWNRWSASIDYDGPHRDAVLRSALALKSLTYAPSGAVLAAATTSLPEQMGGSLNWDYRYCWLRDASLTIRALLGLGFYEEADAFMGWLITATSLTHPEMRILYTVYGENAPHEKTLSHLTGYANSGPVRIGNAARSQLQLDVYGEILDAAAQYAFHNGKFDRFTQKAFTDIGKYVALNWNRPDQGIWEPREAPQHHTHSRLLCWTALDRLVMLCEKGHIENGPLDDFKQERDKIAEQIKARAWNSTLQSYVSILDGDQLDASLLLMSYYGFEAADSDRMKSTYQAIRRNLRAGDHLLYRYADGPTEGAFGICSFWETDYLALGGGSLAEATRLFESLLEYRNDVGLYAEEIDPRNGEALGNFPQAFTHVGLIGAALSLTERMTGEKQLAHREATAEENKAS